MKAIRRCLAFVGLVLFALISQGIPVGAAPIFSDLLALRDTADKAKPFAQMRKIKSAGLGGDILPDQTTNEADETNKDTANGYFFTFAVTAGREVYVTLEDVPGNNPDKRLHPALTAYLIEPLVCGCVENENPTVGTVSDIVTLDAKKVGEFFVFDLTFHSDPGLAALPSGTPANKQVVEDGTVQDLTDALYAGSGIAGANAPFLVLVQSCSTPCEIDIPEPSTITLFGSAASFSAWVSLCAWARTRRRT